MLIRLDEGRLDKMKWRARDAFAPARHGHALEALARGLGANTYAGLRACAADYGGILWDGDESRALAFLAERGDHRRQWAGCGNRCRSSHRA